VREEKVGAIDDGTENRPAGLGNVLRASAVGEEADEKQRAYSERSRKRGRKVEGA